MTQGLVDGNLRKYNADTRAMDFFGPVTGGGSGKVQTLPYVSATPVAWNTKLGAIAVVAITDNVNFSIAAPTGLLAGQVYILTIENTAGVAFGTGTWDAIFKTTGNVPVIATGKNRSFVFYYNGTNLIEVSATAADVAN